MGSSHGFGSSACDYGPLRVHALFRLAFASAPAVKALTSPQTANSPDHSSIGTPSRYRLRGNTLRLLVGARFQFLFHSPPGVLFTFPSRYLFTIGRKRYLALDSGLPGFPPWRRSGWYSRTANGGHALPRTGLSPSMAGLSRAVPLTHVFLTPRWIGRPIYRASRPPNRNACRLSRGSGLGYSRFARHY